MFTETRKNSEHIRLRPRGDVFVADIDTEKVTYRGLRWSDLGAYGKRKFENLLVLQYPENKLRFCYK